MKAKANSVQTLAILALLFTAQGAAAQDNCSSLAEMRAESVADALKAFSDDVLGKSADMWTAQDVANLLANASACHGKPEGMKYRVDAKHWARVMKSVIEKVVPAASRTAAVREAYAPHWTWGEVPSCLKVLSWRRDPVWHADNSAEVFGKDLLELGDTERAMVSGFSNECMPVMVAALKANRLHAPDAAAIVEDIAASAKRAGMAAAENPGDLAESLQVTNAGKPIPLAHISENSRKMVMLTNTIEKNGMKLTTDQMIMLSKWAEKVVNERSGGPERAYSDAVRKVIRKHMFGKL